MAKGGDDDYCDGCKQRRRPAATGEAPAALPRERPRRYFLNQQDSSAGAGTVGQEGAPHLRPGLGHLAWQEHYAPLEH